MHATSGALAQHSIRMVLIHAHTLTISILCIYSILQECWVHDDPEKGRQVMDVAGYNYNAVCSDLPGETLPIIVFM